MPDLAHVNAQILGRNHPLNFFLNESGTFLLLSLDVPSGQHSEHHQHDAGQNHRSRNFQDEVIEHKPSATTLNHTTKERFLVVRGWKFRAIAMPNFALTSLANLLNQKFTVVTD